MLSLGDILMLVQSQLPAVAQYVQNFVGTEGQLAADVIVKKQYGENPSLYAGDPTVPNADGKTPIQLLAQEGFRNYRGYLRKGTEYFPGAPEIPHLEFLADELWDMGDVRTALHNWTNNSAKNLLTTLWSEAHPTGATAQ